MKLRFCLLIVPVKSRIAVFGWMSLHYSRHFFCLGVPEKSSAPPCWGSWRFSYPAFHWHDEKAKAKFHGNASDPSGFDSHQLFSQLPTWQPAACFLSFGNGGWPRELKANDGFISLDKKWAKEKLIVNSFLPRAYQMVKLFHQKTGSICLQTSTSMIWVITALADVLQVICKNTRSFNPTNIIIRWCARCHLLQSAYIDNHFTSHPINLNHSNEIFKNKWHGYKLNMWWLKHGSSVSFCL